MIYPNTAAWGVGKRGQCGHGKREDQKLPKLIVGGIGYGIRIVQVMDKLPKECRS